MPRKTRKQKEKALNNRGKRITLYGPEGSHAGAVNREFEFSFENFSQAERKNNVVKKIDKSLYFYQSASTGRDLIKTVVLAIIIFSLEVVIYFAWFEERGIGYTIYNLINGQITNLL